MAGSRRTPRPGVVFRLPLGLEPSDRGRAEGRRLTQQRAVPRSSDLLPDLARTASAEPREARHWSAVSAAAPANGTVPGWRARVVGTPRATSDRDLGSLLDAATITAPLAWPRFVAGPAENLLALVF